MFGPCLLWANGWRDQDATWYGGRRRPRLNYVTWGPSSPKRCTAPNFRPMSIVAKRSSISATAELLLYLNMLIAGLYVNKELKGMEWIYAYGRLCQMNVY